MVLDIQKENPKFIFLKLIMKSKKISSDAKFLTMISVLAQERLLGAALGTALTGIVVFEQRKRIYESISDHQSQLASQSQIKEPIFGKKSRSEFALLWNKAVDQIFVPVIESISSRRWWKFRVILKSTIDVPITTYHCVH